MRRWIWCVPATMTAGCGLAALVSWSLPATVGWWLAGWLVAVSFRACRALDEDPIRWRMLLRSSLPWPTMTMAFGGLFTVLEPASALLVCGAGLTAAAEAGWFGGSARDERSVGGRRGFGRRWSARATAGATSGTVVSPVVDPVEAIMEVTDELTDSDLCMAWRSSYVALDRAVEPSEKLRAVEIRELLLDELGRRDPRGLDAWFRSGARAAGWPDRYLRGVPPRHRT